LGEFLRDHYFSPLEMGRSQYKFRTYGRSRFVV
jgi:hypothetical protein